MSITSRNGLSRRAALVVVLLFTISAVSLFSPRASCHAEGDNYPLLLVSNVTLQQHGGWGNTHEKTHGVNSVLRNSKGGECFYVLWGRYAKFQRLRQPTLRQVNQYVKRKGGVGWYLTGLPSWNDWPLYLFDELTSYTNEAHNAWNTKRISPGSGHTLVFALEFAHYSATMIQLIPNSYADKKRVAQFWLWNTERLETITQYAQQAGHTIYKSDCAGWLQLMRQDKTIIERLVR